MRLFTNSIVVAALLAAVSVRAADEKPATKTPPAPQSEKKQGTKQQPAPKEAPPPKQGKQASAVKPDRDGSKPAAPPCEEVKPCSIE